MYLNSFHSSSLPKKKKKVYSSTKEFGWLGVRWRKDIHTMEIGLAFLFVFTSNYT